MAKDTPQDDFLGFGFGEEEELEQGGPVVDPTADGYETSGQPDLFESSPESSAAGARPAREGYVVLARRYRPQTFDQIVGQDAVRNALRGAITGDHLGHAYLFSGPRGTGKTSTARILAKALNCLEGGPRPDPCGKCASCRAITNGSSLDVIEIDAASNTGVDNIRDLRTGVVLAPFSRYKVYIVDEVHMLSTAAFNALLKTLEEPPPQVVFILATTDAQKVPETILSRCQVFQFRRFTVEEIANHLAGILDAESKKRNLEISEGDRREIVELLARHAEGGMRDAQVALDQVLVLSRDSLDLDTVRRFLGAVASEQLDQFVTALYERSTEALLGMVQELVDSGQDLERFTQGLAEFVRDLLITRSAPQRPELVNVSRDRRAALTVLGQRLPIAFLLNTADLLLRLVGELKTAAQPRYLLELTLIRLTQVDAVDDIERIVGRLQELEKQFSGGGVAKAAPAAAPATKPQTAPRVAEAPEPGYADQDTRTAQPVPDPSPAAVPVAPAIGATPTMEPTRVPPAVPAGTPELMPDNPPQPVPAAGSVSISPGEFLALLREHTVTGNKFLHVSLLETGILSLSENMAVLAVNPADRFTYDHLRRENNQQCLKDIARSILGREIALRVELAAVEIPPAGPTSPSPLPKESARAASVAQPPPSPAVTMMDREPATDETDEIAEGHPEHEDPPAPQAVARPQRPFRPIRGGQLKQFLEKNGDINDLFQRIKFTFNLDDSQIYYRTRAVQD